MAEKPPQPASQTLIARFQRVYSNLPLEERKLVVLVIGTQEINWEFARREIESESELGKQIGETLIKLNFI